MQRAATEVMEGIILSAVIEAVAALKAASGGLPNNLLREVQSVHSNTTFADLPKELQDSIRSSVRSAFTQLLKDGYSVLASQPGQGRSMSPPSPRREHRGPPVVRGGRPPRAPRPAGAPGGPDKPEGAGPGRGPGKGPGGAPRRPRPPKGKPRMS
ncbi:MAG: hypothetical protein M3Q52_01215 [Pseudomonadota bacterium]|nr:hypothetical protein [Pseudomonadota bacterium]